MIEKKFLIDHHYEDWVVRIFWHARNQSEIRELPGRWFDTGIDGVDKTIIESFKLNITEKDPLIKI